MRDIKFRGKDTLSGRWVYGSLLVKRDESPAPVTQQEYIEAYITKPPFFANEHKVYVDTIGQYTGLKDTDGREIYEGDILTTQNPEVHKLVYWDSEYAQYKLENLNLGNYIDGGALNEQYIKTTGMVIIANQYDNPELQLLKDVVRVNN